MKRIIPLTAGLLIAVIVVVKSQETRITDLSGPYNVVGFTKNEDYSFQQLDAEGLMDFGDKAFDFQDDNTLKLNKKMSENFFKEDLFEFQITAKYLKLRSVKTDLEYKLRYDTKGGVFNLHIDHHPAISRFQLMEWKEN